MPVIVVFVVVLLVGLALAVAARRWSERTARRWIAALDPDGLYDLPAVDEDQGDDVVTWEQVADTLPAGLVDEVRRAVEGRPPVLQPKPADEVPGLRTLNEYAGRRYAGGYARQIVYPAGGGEPYEP